MERFVFCAILSPISSPVRPDSPADKTGLYFNQTSYYKFTKFLPKVNSYFGNFYYHSNTQAPHVNPAPKPESTIFIPLFSLPL